MWSLLAPPSFVTAVGVCAIMTSCASLPSVAGEPITDIDQIVGKWAGTITPRAQQRPGALLFDHHAGWQAGRGWGIDTSWEP